MNRLIRLLITGLLLVAGSNLVVAQSDWNPDNPPEPSAKYRITTKSSPFPSYTSGDGWYSKGDQAWIGTSSYGSGYKFMYWTKNGEKYSEEQWFSYTVEGENVEFVACYEYSPENPTEPDGIVSYRLYLQSNIPNCCSFNRGSGGKVKTGEEVWLNVYSNQGYTFLGWYIDDELICESRYFNYRMPEKDVTLTARFEYSPDNPDEPDDVTAPPKVYALSYERSYGSSNPEFGYYKSKDYVKGEPVISCEADEYSPVGTYPIIIERGSLEGDTVTLVNGVLTITKAPLTISAYSYIRNQGDDNPEFWFDFWGFMNNETYDVLTTMPTASCEATKDSPIGEYVISVSGAEATNYEISYVNGTLTIVDGPITVMANSYTRYYGDANPAFGYTSYGSALNGTPLVTCEATETSPVGVYTITISQGDVSNDDVTYINGTLTIVPAPLTIKAGDYSKMQGEDNPIFIPTYDGFKNDENADVLTCPPVFTCDATKDSPVGEYVISVSGAEAENYEISYVNGSLTVVDGPITVMANSYTRCYGDANPAFGYTSYGSVLNGTPLLTCDATETSPVGVYTIIISQGDVSNDDVTYIDGTLTIVPAPLTIKAGDYSKIQGEENPTFVPNVEGFKNGETLDVLIGELVFTCDATKDSPAGEYVVNVSGVSSENYNITFVVGKLIVEPITFIYGGDEVKDEDDPATYQVTTIDDKNPTVAIICGDNVNGKFAIPEALSYNGKTYTVTEIAEGSFMNNVELTDITIPATITSIKENAFKECSSLMSITIYVVTPINLSVASTREMMTRAGGISVFEGVNKETCILYVPEGSVNLYKVADGWNEFVNIRAIGNTGINSILRTDGKPSDIYNLSGRRIRQYTSSLDELPRGVYIVNGKKIVVR